MDPEVTALVSHIRARCEGVLPNLKPGAIRTIDGIEERATTDLEVTFGYADQAFSALTDGKAEAAKAANDPVWSADEQKRRHDEALREAARTAQEDSETALNRLDTARSRLEKAALPARPQADRAGQEAQLANLKADTRMVLDSAAPEDLVAALVDEVRRVVDEGDKLALWLFASSSWPSQYLKSRFAEATDSELAFEQFAHELPDLIDPARSKEATKARTYLALWTRAGREDSLVDLATVVRHVVRSELAEMPSYIADPED